MNDGMWLWLALVDLVILTAFAMLGIWQRRILLGVYVPPAHRGDAEVVAMRRSYVWTVVAVLALVAAAGSVALWLLPEALETVLAGTFSLQFVAAIAVYGRFHHRARALKAQAEWGGPSQPARRVASLTYRRELGQPGLRWYAVHLGVVAVSVVAAALMWDRIPEVFAIHFNVRGEADGWSERTVQGVFGQNLVQLVLIAIFAGTATAIGRMRQQLDPDDPQRSLAKRKQYNRLSAYFLWALSLLVTLFLSLLQGMTLYGWPQRWALGLGLALPLVILIAVGLFLYQLRSKGLESIGDEQAQADRYWRLGGLVYYNPADPALLVEKRVGVGMTVNFARPLSWLLLGAVLAVASGTALIAILTSG
ncbi:DUF1648 domain-containing protein [Paenibacillus sp. IB182496]|uniref:DUF1648 domain-containing protein n=1 Tax=Paenibacillus sabuli TaxID=2772509 RepID=A0A927BQB6_9BACL|nr:DUF5808 domain-containing protein [Paenibacillus sabuli]MBD2844783.1 DUF1648 domain-containing protein [Paenibacillus sabuli]